MRLKFNYELQNLPISLIRGFYNDLMPKNLPNFINPKEKPKNRIDLISSLKKLPKNPQNPYSEFPLSQAISNIQQQN